LHVREKTKVFFLNPLYLLVTYKNLWSKYGDINMVSLKFGDFGALIQKGSFKQITMHESKIKYIFMILWNIMRSSPSMCCVLNFKRLFISLINMNMLFDFVTMIMKNHMLHKHLSRFLDLQINANRYSFCKKRCKWMKYLF
jgi:hypothetical protein